jgi:hypothetical protein
MPERHIVAIAVNDSSERIIDRSRRAAAADRSVEQAALGAFVAELFVCPPSDGCIWIVVRQRLHQIVLADDEQPF